MSDMFLELRSRIPVVAQQTHIGKTRLQDAQDAVGLSNESVARKVPISEKTWRRWKEAGAIPTASLPAVAKALRLELHDLDASLVDEGITDRLDRLEGQVSEMHGLLVALARASGVTGPEVPPHAEEPGQAA